MDVKQLRYFAKAAELGSVSLAAVHLQTAQPAISRQIARLEKELGVVLLVRHGRGVSLTEAGVRLLDHARTVLDQLELARHEVAAAGERPGGVVTIGMPRSAADLMAASFIEQMSRSSPDIHIRVLEGFGGHLAEWLLNGTLDAAILYSPRKAQSLSSDIILEEDLMMVGPAGAEALRPQGTPIAALARLPMILPSRSQNLRQMVERVAHRQRVTLSVPYEVDSLGVTKELVHKGLGYTVLTIVSVRAELEEGSFGASPLVRPAMSRTVSITTASGRPLSAGARLALQELRQEMEKLVRLGVWPGRLRARGLEEAQAAK